MCFMITRKIHYMMMNKYLCVILLDGAGLSAIILFTYCMQRKWDPTDRPENHPVNAYVASLHDC